VKHDLLLSLARRRKLCSGECEAVVDCFLRAIWRTVLRYGERLENPSCITNFRPGASQQIMFNDCRTLRNEEQILENGFQVSQAVSYPKGTWLAGNALYSDAGDATHENGVNHLFLCLVSDAEVALDRQTWGWHWHSENIRRAVGQNCAHPVWLVKYTHCDGIPMLDEDLDGDDFGYFWGTILDAFGHERMDELCNRVDRRVSLRAQFDDVLIGAGRHRKSRSGGSDVMRGSGHIFQLKHHGQLLHSNLAHTETSTKGSQKKVQERAARMKQKRLSYARRKAACVKMHYFMHAM